MTIGSPVGAAQGIAQRMRKTREPQDARVADIGRLAGLRDSGALTEEEFAQEKARILAHG